MINSSITQSDCRYTKGGKTTISANKLGWWERRIFSKSTTDVTLVLISKYNKRPDLLAYDLYGKSSLAWFILQYNNISDIVDFESGLELVLPTRSRLYNDILSTTN